MNRNKNNNFSLLPSANIQRSKFDRSQSVKFTFNVGELIPFYVDEVLPGDTMQIKTSKMVRLQTPATPIMDDLYLDTYYFFVPNRLVWDHWKEFNGENNNSKWIPTTDYRVPQLKFPAFSGTAVDHDLGELSDSYLFFSPGSVADYMGLPAMNGSENGNFAVPIKYFPLSTGVSDGFPTFNALPFRAYALICNEWFRDENLQDPLFIDTGDSDYNGWFDNNNLSVDDFNSANNFSSISNDERNLKSPVFGGKPFIASKYHDYFTSALPSPQKGPTVSVPVSSILSGDGLAKAEFIDSNSKTGYYIIRNSSGALVTSTSDVNALYSTALVEGGAGIDINSLRLAFATQAQYERDARGGTRYTEIIRSNFGVISPDSRLQRPEYLGGNHVRLNINQVVQQSGEVGSNGSFLGDTGAFSATADSHGDFIQSFTEHGFIIGVCVARYNHSYQNGAEKFWFRKSRFDYYLPAFANLGEQPIKQAEIYIGNKVGNQELFSNSTFGYQEAWADYRFKPNRVAGEMRSGVVNSLDIWHLADNYDSMPFLSANWIKEDKNNVDRVLTVTSRVSNQLLADFYIENTSTRPIPMYSIPATLGGSVF
nr:MAG: major capsid protein [Microviridae sp.]